MACRTRAKRTVQVETADAGIGPGTGVKERAAVFVFLDTRDRGGVRRLAVRARFEIVDGNRRAVGRLQGDLAAVALLTADVGTGHAVHVINGPLARRRRV